MIDIPLNKALVAVEEKLFPFPGKCRYCEIPQGNCRKLSCRHNERKDGKNVIFKLINLPGEVKEDE